jgi:putative tricarboxylic transport membrane protein
MADQKMVKKDFITSIILISFSVSVIVMSYTMPRLERRGIDPFSVPGVVPGLLGAVLLILALILFVRSIRQGGYRILPGGGGTATSAPAQGAAGRVLLTLAISLVYAIVLLGRYDYTLSTGLYIFTFICLFEYRKELGLSAQKKMFLTATIQAVVSAVLVTLVFQKLFLVDLP